MAIYNSQFNPDITSYFTVIRIKATILTLNTCKAHDYESICLHDDHTPCSDWLLS